MDGFNSLWISDPNKFPYPGLATYASSLSSAALTPIFNFKGYLVAGEQKPAHFIAAQCFRVRQSAYSNCNCHFMNSHQILNFLNKLYAAFSSFSPIATLPSHVLQYPDLVCNSYS